MLHWVNLFSLINTCALYREKGARDHSCMAGHFLKGSLQPSLHGMGFQNPICVRASDHSPQAMHEEALLSEETQKDHVGQEKAIVVQFLVRLGKAEVRNASSYTTCPTADWIQSSLESPMAA